MEPFPPTSANPPTNTTSEKFELVQNLISTLTVSHQPLLNEQTKVFAAFKQFMEETSKAIEENSKKTTTLEAKVIELETEKKQIIETHAREKEASNQTLISIQSQSQMQAQQITALQAQLSSLNTKHGTLQYNHSNHTHLYSWGQAVVKTNGPSQ